MLEGHLSDQHFRRRREGVDASQSPPILYVACFGNNRVLAWKNTSAFSKGDYEPSNNPTQTDFRLVDAGKPAVDSGNCTRRMPCNAWVLRFPAPFSQPAGDMPPANLMPGQASFFGQAVKDVSRQTMISAYGLAPPRVAIWWCPIRWPIASCSSKRVGGDFQSGASATNLFGQADFGSSLPTAVRGPGLISLDCQDQL
jgi:hypothetical protein